LMLEVCDAAVESSLPIYLYGADGTVVEKLSRNLVARFRGLDVAGAEPSLFRPFSVDEREAFYVRVRESGAALIFIGLGCPRQEVFAYECADELGIPVISVGAAFDYHAGVVAEPLAIVQRLGLQWLVRLMQDPRRLWKRYLGFNSLFLLLLGLQRVGAWRPAPTGVEPQRELMYG
jgi:N-acetylglucosaminyldiphosphoundecaprenol N-acetyl-beta-D-mannosaminyltransferase